MDEKKYLKISLSTGILIAIIVILIVALVGMYFYYNPKKENENLENKNIASENLKNNINEGKLNNNSENKVYDNTIKNPYEKYSNSNLEWYFSKKETTLHDDFIIENGNVYLTITNKRQQLTSIPEKAKYIAGWINGGVLERLYVLTENGNIYRVGGNVRECKDIFDLIDAEKIDEFYKVNLPETVIDMTDGDFSTRIVEAPYFLLDNGELINEDGSKYEELEGNFIKRFGTIEGTIFVAADNTIYEYNDETRKYIQIKDNNGKTIKLTTRMKSVFIQSPSTLNNLETKNSTDRIIIVTEDNKLLYFDGYENVSPKEYEGSIGKTVKNAVVNEIPDEYGGHSNNARIIFSDETEITIIDV